MGRISRDHTESAAHDARRVKKKAKIQSEHVQLAAEGGIVVDAAKPQQKQQMQQARNQRASVATKPKDKQQEKQPQQQQQQQQQVDESEKIPDMVGDVSFRRTEANKRQSNMQKMLVIGKLS